MSDEGKIKISWDDIESVPEQPTAPPAPAAPSGDRESWGHVRTGTPTGVHAGSRSSGSVFYRAWFYLGLAGLIAGVLAWGLQEIVPYGLTVETYADLEAYLEELSDEAKQQYSTWDRMTLSEQLDVVGELAAADRRRDSGILFALIGAILAAGLGMAEGVVSRSQVHALRGGGLGLLAGAIGGFAAGVFAQWLYATLLSDADATDGINAVQIVARSIGWAVAGAIAGTAFGLAYLSMKRCVLGLLGGFVGGLIGGVLFDWIGQATESDEVSRFVGIVAIGVAAGVLISLAEQVAKSAWVQIEAGRLIGKQFVIYRNPTRVGALPANEIYLFKDSTVAPEHARIERRGNAHFLVDGGSQTGTRVNGQVIRDHRLRDGDSVQIGETVLRYGER